ncbi:Mak10 subunit, NatC N-terminal acetyltransferase-domain-containing protein [Cantharellus anzutake]|uniref:Mak10 subunit, NatC N-terminal acetyltransferase-domain-containing protein n=1 Tax=Cantharellus anzutake TaxID=1750568 RepID=UPI001908ED31|nr:Mak10 subunit, NatC N-terminal acetyltransferase-domain-containing protein [Cantharellus anzutake]KAF8328832.1 Mak10 subunit, NatC N-terminal acetyltransferase-domain-containing protein [Cantharellus anzutake]
MWFQPGEDESWSIPGGPYYTDVTSLVTSAVDQLSHDELLKMDGFSLVEAMSAIEIMDSRLDSGLAKSPEAVSPTPFDPFVALTSEELCWLIDRTFAAEMTWHQGRALSQTIYTILYVHYLQDLEPLRWYRHQPVPPSPAHPGSLMVQVLNSDTFMRSDTSPWDASRILSFDCVVSLKNEDVMTEKSDVSLCESTQTARVVESLESAENWLLRQSNLPGPESCPPGAITKVSRSCIFATPTVRYYHLGKIHITQQGNFIQDQRTRSPSTPGTVFYGTGSHDPAVCRKLINHIPLPVISLFDQDITWQSLNDTLLGLEDLCSLETPGCLAVPSQTILSVKSTYSPSFRRSAYVRSRTTSTFGSSNTLILNKHKGHWLLSDSLFQIAGIPPSFIETLYVHGDHLVLRAWYEFETKAVEDTSLESIYLYFKHLSNNRPRQRRQFSKNLGKWDALHDMALALSEPFEQLAEQKGSLERMALVFLHLKLVQIIEILFSGFEIELYRPDEVPFIYWYLEKVLSRQRGVLSALFKGMRESGGILIWSTFSGFLLIDDKGGDAASDYLQSQALYCDALQSMCHAAFMRLAGAETVRGGKISPNLQQLVHRRLEWSSTPRDPKPLHGDLDAPSPDLEAFMVEVMEIQETGTSLSAQEESWANAISALDGLLACDPEMTFPTFSRGVDMQELAFSPPHSSRRLATP